MSTPSPLVAQIDGASRGNPGPASYGIWIPVGPDGSPAWGGWGFLGSDTNNVAEYTALVRLLGWAREAGIASLDVRSDSELMVRQMEGRYRVKAANLQPLFAEALRGAKALRSFRISHVRREQNREADRLANHALDTRTTAPVGPLPEGLIGAR